MDINENAKNHKKHFRKGYQGKNGLVGFARGVDMIVLGLLLVLLKDVLQWFWIV